MSTYRDGQSTSERRVAVAEPHGSTLWPGLASLPHVHEAKGSRGEAIVSPSRRSCQVMPVMGVADEDIMMVVMIKDESNAVEKNASLDFLMSGGFKSWMN